MSLPDESQRVETFALMKREDEGERNLPEVMKLFSFSIFLSVFSSFFFSLLLLFSGTFVVPLRRFFPCFLLFSPAGFREVAHVDACGSFRDCRRVLSPGLFSRVLVYYSPLHREHCWKYFGTEGL